MKKVLSLDEDIKSYFDNALKDIDDSKFAFDNERYKLSINCSYYAMFLYCKGTIN